MPRVNKVKAKIKAGEKAFGVGFNFPALQLIEQVGSLGFDYIFIDGEHGVFTMKDVEEMCMLADKAGLTPICRVPSFQPWVVLQWLDRGVMGIMGPHIVTKQDAIDLVRACKFAPEGVRSFTGHRVMGYQLPDDASKMMADANEQVMVSALIEDAGALKNLPEILTVPGLDVLSFGPFDLSQSMGFPGQRNHPKVKEAMDKAAAQIRASGKTFGGDKILSIGLFDMVRLAGTDFLKKNR